MPKHDFKLGQRVTDDVACLIIGPKFECLEDADLLDVWILDNKDKKAGLAKVPYEKCRAKK